MRSGQDAHTPSGYDCGVRHGNILYFSHPVFRHYRAYGVVVNRAFLDDATTFSTNLPSIARVALTIQPEAKRHVLHLLYAPTINRGGTIQLFGGSLSNGKTVEVIGDLPPLPGVEVTLRLPASVRGARLVPQGGELPLKRVSGRVTLSPPPFSCHQMIEFDASPP